ncbi:selenide, water dikinase SelD [Methanospirillum lacunae]|uniref:Selenide, water dikinase SelD n=1 Tax=Methanospirillum lacunae TaxID=668570 RepID=A0A2V2N5R2_9EURY|nr:selenide, water dikinase SelD [Methanospirillum lacunae]PWR73940.1 selenide, water dikinase SelD [Methanospirillum lacunae]
MSQKFPALTDMVDLFGCSCKLPENELEKLLEAIGGSYPENVLGPGDDAAIIKINENIVLIKTVDFFTPIVDDPYLQGEIAACNCTNDVFAMGGTVIAGVLAILGLPRGVSVDQSKKLLGGFRDFCDSIKAPLVGGHTIINPWPIIGGAVTGVAHPKEIIYNSGAKPGDVLLLTKPVGIQPIMSASRIYEKNPEEIDSIVDSSDLQESVDIAITCMTTSNQKAAEAVQVTGAHALTDVTGFGLYGHAAKIADNSHVTLNIHTIPSIKNAPILSDFFGFGLEKGISSETAGGLLISIAPDAKNDLIAELSKREIPAYEVGFVTKYHDNPVLLHNPNIQEISSLTE